MLVSPFLYGAHSKAGLFAGLRGRRRLQRQNKVAIEELPEDGVKDVSDARPMGKAHKPSTGGGSDEKQEWPSDAWKRDRLHKIRKQGMTTVHGRVAEHTSRTLAE